MTYSYQPEDSNKVHADTEYQLLEPILSDVNAAFQSGDPNVTAEFIDQVIPYEVLTHITQHHVRAVTPQYLPPALFQITYLAMSRLFIDGFLAGSRLQSKRDADLLGTGINIPDDPGSLDDAA